MTIRIRVVGCQRYSLKGELFEKGFVYDLDDSKARELLASRDDYGRQYFARVEQTVDDTEELAVEAARTSEDGTVRIKRSRGRPRKNAVVKTAGDSSSLEDEDDADASDEDADEGIPV